ncbi:MAG: hypothetical protein IJT56_06450 [Clostridia bacterium]|nr:hypothetical protein [Clostridia bacterium]
MSLKRRITSILLLTAVAAGSISACGESAGSSPAASTTAASAEPSQIAETEAEETTNAYIPDDIPDTDFGGETVTFAAPTWYGAPSFIYASELDGEVINDAFYNQRMSIQERFNVSIDLFVKNDEGGGTQLEKDVHKMVQAGDSGYDLIYNGDGCGVRNGLGGDFLNLRAVSSIDFDKPWFSGTSDLFTIGGRLFFTANTFSISSIYMSSTLTINKKLASDFGLEVPYDQARAGSWTLDALLAMTANMDKDINGDGKMTEEDQYGFLSQQYSELCMQCNLGGAMIGKNAEGWLELTPDENRIVSIIEKCSKLFENGSNKFGASNESGVEVFVKGNSLFCFMEGRLMNTKVRQYDITYGILPFPKYDENQENYSAAGYDLYWGIPVTSEKAEMTGTLVSAMSCYNYNIIVPQVWEIVLGSKLADAPDDAEMFEIIRDVQYVDIGYAASTAMSSLSGLCFLIHDTKPDTVVSTIEKKKNSVINSIDKFNDKFAALDG